MNDDRTEHVMSSSDERARERRGLVLHGLVCVVGSLLVDSTAAETIFATSAVLGGLTLVIPIAIPAYRDFVDAHFPIEEADR